MSMGAGFLLPDWNALAGLDDDSLPLLGTALLIARDEYPDLEAGAYDALLQRYADEVRPVVADIEQWQDEWDAPEKRDQRSGGRPSVRVAVRQA